MPNGLTLLVESRKSDSVAVEVSVAVGSNMEPAGQEGISHFLEHMLFNGSVKRPTAYELTNAIECVGGMLNGGTSNEQTTFYAKVPSRHFSVVLDVLADMVLNPLLKAEEVERERGVILNEIHLFTDDPKLHIWVLLQKRLYRGHPAGKPVYGTLESVKSITRRQIVGFHRKYYVPGNMAVTIVGDVGVEAAVREVKKKFAGMKSGVAAGPCAVMAARQAGRETYREKRKILQSYMVLACKTPPRSHPDSYALDVIHAILGRHSSGRMFDEIRNKRGLAYEVNVQNESLKTFGFFAVYVVADSKNLRKIVSIISGELKKLSRLREADLREAKTFIEGEFLLDNEDNLKRAEVIGFFNHAGEAGDAVNYLEKVRKVSLADAKRAARKYLNEKYTLVVVG